MAVARDVKFNRFGIPYVMEFSNVSFRAGRDAPRRSQTAPMPPLTRTDTTASRASSSSQLSQSLPHGPPLRSYTRSPQGRRRNTITRSPTPPSEPLTSWCSIPSFEPPQPAPSPRVDVAKPGRGLYIQFTPYVPTSESPPHEGRPRPVTSRSAVLRLRRAIAAAVQESGMESPNAERTDPLEEPDSPGGRSARSTKSLFRGTYGQVMSALKEAGLMTTPCPEEGLEKATKLGALFIVVPNDAGGVEFNKLTLWG